MEEDGEVAPAEGGVHALRRALLQVVVVGGRVCVRHYDHTGLGLPLLGFRIWCQPRVRRDDRRAQGNAGGRSFLGFHDFSGGGFAGHSEAK